MMRFRQALGPDRPIDAVAYAFIFPEQAHANLHELWLREIECWTFTPEGEKVRIDDTYDPPPYQKPQWVQTLEAETST